MIILHPGNSLAQGAIHISFGVLFVPILPGVYVFPKGGENHSEKLIYAVVDLVPTILLSEQSGLGVA